MTPADLDLAVSKLLDELTSARRALADLKHEYARLDASALAVDELGEPITPAAALTAAREALADVDRSLGLSTDAVYVAMGYTSRLYEQGM